MGKAIEDRYGKRIVPQGNDASMTEIEIRLFLGDADPEANLLLDDYKFSSEEIRTCMNLAMDKWNDTPPDIYRGDYDKFPYRSILLLGTAAYLLSIAAHKYRANSLPINAGGVSVNDQGKAAEYDNAAANLRAEFLQAVRMKKRELNCNLGWGFA